MIISTDIKIPLDNILNLINNYKSDIQSIALVHGSSSQLNKVFYVSDIDIEYWMRYENNKKNLFKNFNDIVNLLLKNNMYFVNLIAGNDDRFNFDFDIRKNGEVINYDIKKIRKQFNILYDKNIINEKDLEKIMEYSVDNPTLISCKKLEIVINEYKKIQWTLEEIKKGEKIHYGKKFKLYDVFMVDVFLSIFVFEYSKGNYILFDFVFHIFSLSDNFKNLSGNSKKIYDLLINNSKLYGETSRKTTLFYYDSIFKNYVKGYYLKMLKRLKSLLTEIYFRPDIIDIINHNLNKKIKEDKYKNLIKNTRNDINNFVKSKKIACINQLKSRIDTIIILTKYKKELEIKRLIIEALNDLKESCNYYPDNINKIYNILNNYDKNNMISELIEFKNILFKNLNDTSLEYLKIYINKLQFLLPFTLELPIKI